MDYLVDTNVLMYAAKNKVDLQELTGKKPIILKPVVDELTKLKNTGKLADRRNAKLALDIIKKKNYKITYVRRLRVNVDTLILELAKKHSLTVITNDLVLRKRLKKNNQRVMFLRQGRLLGD